VTTRDDQLLDVLAASLGPPPDAEPTWAEISQLHRVIDHGWSGRERRLAPLWRIRRPVTAAVASLAVLGGASAAAAVSGAVMPQPVRVAARAVGLPVDSPQLASARAALAHLRDALADKPRDLGAIRADAQAVRDHLGRLSADDRFQVEDESAFLLAEADAALAPPPASLGGAAPVSPSTPSNPASPSAPGSPAPAAGGDDHGGRSTPSAAPERAAPGSDDHGSGDDHSGSSAQPAASTDGGPGPSASSGDGDHTATTIQTNTSGHDGGSSTDGGGSDGGGSGSDGGGSSGSDGGGHSGPD